MCVRFRCQMHSLETGGDTVGRETGRENGEMQAMERTEMDIEEG